MTCPDSDLYSRRSAVAQLLLLPALAPVVALAKSLPLAFACAPDNDLYRAVTAGGASCPRYDTPAEAVAQAARGGCVLLLADGYPARTTVFDSQLFAQVRDKKLRIYLEYPSWLPGMQTGAPSEIKWERAVVTSDAFGPSLAKMQILAIQDCHFVPVEARNPDLVIARVAGFRTAVYGLPDTGVHPILFEHPEGGILVSTTKLSQFVTGRYAPVEVWGTVWKRVFTWLSPRSGQVALRWTPSVRPSFQRAGRLPANVEIAAFRRGVDWFQRAHLFPGSGDGKDGVDEGFSSKIRYDGSQTVGTWRRSDCNGEVSMSMAFRSVIDNNPSYGRIAANLDDFIFFRSQLAQGARNDPKNPAYGLIGWGTPNSLGVYYGDDNARCMLGTMAASALLQSGRWNEPLLRCLLGNLRTTGKLGFRGNRIDQAPLERNGWRHYFDSEKISYAPHYEAFLWACFLWAQDKTGFDLFRERAKNAIRMTMAAYPNEWHWTNGIQQERARMLLPLAWLLRLEDTAEHRGWLRKIAQDLLALQDKCGAIREEIGSAGKGSYAPPKSNAAYGTAEAPLIQENGEPVSDLLYTTNFAFLGLHEAAAASGERLYIDAAEKLAKFLCRIQIRSEAHPELDGGFFRAIDYKLWDYWASNADLGWGAWSIETGWTQAWITSVLAMRHRKTSLWELTAGSRIKDHFDTFRRVMLPDAG